MINIISWKERREKEGALTIINAQVDIFSILDTHQSYFPIFLFILPAKFLAKVSPDARDRYEQRNMNTMFIVSLRLFLYRLSTIN